MIGDSLATVPAWLLVAAAIVAASIAIIVILVRVRLRGTETRLRLRSSSSSGSGSASSSGSGRRSRTRRQVAAVPVRVGADDTLEVLVITTRGSGRWTVPKGWPMRGRSDPDAAAREAYEEAGVRGTIVAAPIGTFAYAKRRDRRETLLVTVYRLDVTAQARRWRERGQRRQAWLGVSEAANRVAR